MVSFEIFVKAMRPSLLELKVLPSLCFAFKIPDDVAASSMYVFAKDSEEATKLSISSSSVPFSMSAKFAGSPAPTSEAPKQTKHYFIVLSPHYIPKYLLK